MFTHKMSEEEDESRFNEFMEFLFEYDILNVKRMLIESDYIDLSPHSRGNISLEHVLDYYDFDLGIIVLLQMLLSAGADPNSVVFDLSVHTGSLLNMRDKLLVEAGLVDTLKLISVSEFGYNGISRYHNHIAIERTVTLTFLLESRF